MNWRLSNASRDSCASWIQCVLQTLPEYSATVENGLFKYHYHKTVIPFTASEHRCYE
jgi:hypothetical protein